MLDGVGYANYSNAQELLLEKVQDIELMEDYVFSFLTN